MEWKEQMGIALKSINADLKELRKQQKAAEKANRRDFRLLEQIERREKQKKYYKVTESEPFRFENGVVINAKTLKAYLKKLPKSANVSHNLDADRLLIQWRTFGGAGGSLHLKDLSKRYESFKLPAGEGLLNE